MNKVNYKVASQLKFCHVKKEIFRKFFSVHRILSWILNDNTMETNVDP